MSRHRANVVVLAGLLFVAAPAIADIKTIDLRFTPNLGDREGAPSLAPDVLELPVRIADATDGREGLDDPSIVGRFLNKDVEIRSDDPVPPFVTDVAHRLFERWNLSIDPRSRRVVEIEVKLFEVEIDKGAFNANVHLVTRVRDLDRSTTTYLATHAGHDGTVGFRSREANYSRVLSNALQKAIADLVSDPKFQDALAGRAESVVRTVIRPENLLNALLRMRSEGVSDDVLLDYVRGQDIRGPFTDDDVVAWKRAGMPEAVLREAIRLAR